MSENITILSLDDLNIAPLTDLQKEKAIVLIGQIRHGVDSISMSRFDIGCKMLQLCEITGYGSFEPIRNKFFNVKRRTAQRYMAVAREFGQFREGVLHLYFSDLAKLAENNKLSRLRTELLETLQRGQHPNRTYYNKVINDLLNEKEDESGHDDAGDRDRVSNRSHTVNKTSQKGSESKKADLMDDQMDVLDELIPKNIDHQMMLLNLLRSNSGKKAYIEYIILRLRDLTRECLKVSPDDGEMASAEKVHA